MVYIINDIGELVISSISHESEIPEIRLTGNEKEKKLAELEARGIIPVGDPRGRRPKNPLTAIA